MSRIRTVKPEYWKDEKVGRLSVRARLLFIALWSFADDMGTARGAVPYLRAEAFPYDDVSLAEVGGCLEELKREGLVRAFVDQGQTYLSIRHWRRHQKISHPGGAKFPDPPGEDVNSLESSGGLRLGSDPIRSDPTRSDQNQNPRARAQESLTQDDEQQPTDDSAHGWEA